MLPLAEPIGNGRASLGVSDTIAVHESATARNIAVAASTTRTRLPGAAAHSHSNARAGNAISASPSLTLNATPITAAASSDQRIRPLSRARQEHHSAPTSSAASTESIVSLRAVSTDTGSTASASAAASAAPAPKGRRRAPNSRPQASTPPSASGKCSPNSPNPRMRVAATCSHRSTGGLSIETVPLGSSAPKKKSCQEVPMLRTAAS